MRMFTGGVVTKTVLALVGVTNDAVDPDTQITFSPTPVSGEVKLNAGSWLPWETNDTFELVGIDLSAESAGLATLYGRDDGGPESTASVTVPTFTGDDNGDYFTDAAGAYYVD